MGHKGEGKLTLLGIVVTDSVVNVREIYRLHNLKNSWNLAVLFHGWVWMRHFKYCCYCDLQLPCCKCQRNIQIPQSEKFMKLGCIVSWMGLNGALGRGSRHSEQRGRKIPLILCRAKRNIHCSIIQIHLAILTNTFGNLDKYILQFGQIHLAIRRNTLDKYIQQ